MENELPKCDVCGKPATNAARDVYRTPDIVTGYYHQWPSKAVRYGCDEHECSPTEYIGIPPSWDLPLGQAPLEMARKTSRTSPPSP